MSGVSGSCGAGRGPVSLTHRQDAAILQRYNADLGRQSLGEPHVNHVDSMTLF